MCPRKPSDHLDVMVLPSTLASLTLPSVDDACARKPCRVGALLSPREQSAATLIAATVRLHQARREPTASRARQDAYPVSTSAAAAAASAASSAAASSSTSAAAPPASVPAAASLLSPPPRSWRRSSRQHLELGVAVATSPLRGVRLLWRCLPGGSGRQAARLALPPPMSDIDLRPIPPIYSPRSPRSSAHGSGSYLAFARPPSPSRCGDPSPSGDSSPFWRTIAEAEALSVARAEAVNPNPNPNPKP